jgi:N utilization substance protein B
VSDRDESPYRGGVGSRREARERALGLLYEAEAKSQTPAEIIDALPLAPDEFAASLIIGVGDHLDEIDATIRAYSHDWPLERMPSLDRALLRMGIYELTFTPEVPTGAVISEAVELAKTFSTDDSGKFVNGLLSAVAADVR